MNELFKGRSDMYQGLRIVDFHCHFPYEERKPPKPMTEKEQRRAKILKDYAEQLRRQWRLEWDFAEPEKGPQDPHDLARRWNEEIDKYELELVVFVTGNGNDNLASYIAPYKERMVGFAHHDIQAPDALQQLKHAVEELGFRGLKLFGPRMRIPFESQELEPIWEYCAERELPVLIHFGVMGGGGGVSTHPFMNPLTIHEVAKRYPEMPIIVPHFGAGYWMETLHLAWACPNIYIDSSGSNQWIRWMPYPLDIESLFRKAFETVGPKRIIFATDSSWFPRGFAVRYLQDQLRACRYIGMNNEQLQDIFADNALRLLKLK